MKHNISNQKVQTLTGHHLKFCQKSYFMPTLLWWSSVRSFVWLPNLKVSQSPWPSCYNLRIFFTTVWPLTLTLTFFVVVVVVVMTSPSGTAYMGEQKCPKEMRKSTRLWIRRDPSLPRDSWQPYYWLGHHSMAPVVSHSWHIAFHCQTIDVDGCLHTVKLQSVLRLCSGFYRSKDPTNSI